MLGQNIKLISKYKVNQILFGTNCLIFLFSWFFLCQNLSFFESSFLNIVVNFSALLNLVNFSWNLILLNLVSSLQFFGLIFLIVSIFSFNLHYFMNLVHLSSHRLLSKNKTVNSLLGNISAIFCGLTLADFASTHLIHHQFLHTQKDPDQMIAHAPHFLVLPFYIFWHDFWFWQNGLWRQNRFIGYLIDRIVQICLVLVFWYFGKLNLWLVFWLLPIYLVGFFNGMFLFYFPHFQTNWEKKRRLIEQNNQKDNYQISNKSNQNSNYQHLKQENSFEQKTDKNINLENLVKTENDSTSFGNNQNKLKRFPLIGSARILNNKFVNKIQISKTKNNVIKLNYFDQLGLFIIDLSRYSHALHHNQIHSNWAYFPIITKILKPKMLVSTNKFVKEK